MNMQFMSLDGNDSSDHDISNMKITFDSINSDYDAIRKKIYKEMEIEEIQNKIYMKLKGTTKTNNFTFKRCDDKAMFYEKKEKTVSEEKESFSLEEEDDSDIIDLNDIPDESEEKEVFPKSKFLDLEAEEGSSSDEIDQSYEEFDFQKDIKNQELLLERFQRKYMRKKEKNKQQSVKIADYVSSSSDAFDFQQVESEEERMEFEKDENEPECAQNEGKRQFD
ncbi:hypothetical protein M153_1650005536 [Pseudoloma neurophilia]|uniref:Uncharacterized protein n=1 Tax=Pseudoloma neurophilia TaxID=146866 RepID=A0A0R0M8N0_9MICR|nr:hypothetical protein M153_1650005536 [Pseudoloma neurophilia]